MQLKTIPEDFVVVEIADHNVQESGPYMLLEMTKRNLSTERAVSMLSDSLQLPRRFFGYAGAKDARALTKQYVSVKATPALAEAIKRLRRDNISVRLRGHISEPLGLGMLRQNRFEIVARKLKDERLSPMTTIPNYFDEQRFSSANARIGKLLVQKDFLGAAQLIISTDPDAAGRMREHLAEKPNDAVTALRLIPKNLLLMYVHAYQSLLFNEQLSAYIGQHDPGATLVDGPVPIMVPGKDLAQTKLPLIGFDTEPTPLVEDILKREGLTLRDFINKAMPHLTVEGGLRDACFAIESLEIGPREKDDLFPGFEKQRLSFTLPKSCYATMVVKMLYRCGDISGKDEN